MTETEPEEMQVVFFKTGKSIYIGERSNGFFWESASCPCVHLGEWEVDYLEQPENTQEEPTHWQPLPELPKEEG